VLSRTKAEVSRVACPTCGQEVAWSPAAPWRPFCSERCRLIDLGAWFTEERAIPGNEAPESQAADADSGQSRG
jgi:endogenous inhibitor of DNA gyrase (YacG/DUF329 family)